MLLNYSASTSSDSRMRFAISWRDVMIMMSLHEVKSSCKCKCGDTSWLSNSNNHTNRQRIIFLAHLQADIDKVSFVMSYNVSDVMASRNDITTYANKKSMIFLSSATQNTIETKKNHISSIATSWNRYSMFNDVILWRYSIMQIR